MQRVGKFFEVSAVAFLGLWACYFTSFFLGVGTMSLIGAVRIELSAIRVAGAVHNTRVHTSEWKDEHEYSTRTYCY